MATLSGIVAVLNEAENAVQEVRDLGPTPVPIKGTRVRPLEEVKAALAPNEIYTGFGDVIQAAKVVRTWTKVVRDLAAEDTVALNAMLAEEGSLFRAVTILMFKEINKLRVKNGDPAYTKAQFDTALKAEMRTPT